MSLAATVKAMAAAGLSAEQIADVVTRVEDERLSKARAGNAKRQQALRDRRNANNAVTDVTRNARNAENGVTAVTQERPHTPKESSPPPSGTPKGAPSVVPPAGGRSGRKSTRLPPDWQPSAEGRAFARKHGHNEASIDREVEKIRNWSASSPNGACRDWEARWRNWILQASPPARAGPNGQRQTGRTVAEMAQMDLSDEFGFDDDQHRTHASNGTAERPNGSDQGGSGFAGRLSVEDAAAARRSALVDR